MKKNEKQVLNALKDPSSQNNQTGGITTVSIEMSETLADGTRTTKTVWTSPKSCNCGGACSGNCDKSKRRTSTRLGSGEFDDDEGGDDDEL